MSAESESLGDAARQMTNEQLVTAVEAIRGTSKRGRRRRLTMSETLALAAIIEEQVRRSYDR